MHGVPGAGGGVQWKLDPERERAGCPWCKVGGGRGWEVHAESMPSRIQTCQRARLRQAGNPTLSRIASLEVAHHRGQWLR
eukprot:3115640-Rhodomonas_salina.2